MQLLTQELRQTTPPLYSQENEADPICRAKFFMPAGAFTWYVIEGATREREGCGFGVNCQHRPLSEYDPDRDDVLFFGYVIGLEAELGYFTLSELTAVRGMVGLPVERDRLLYSVPAVRGQDRSTGVILPVSRPGETSPSPGRKRGDVAYGTMDDHPGI